MQKASAVLLSNFTRAQHSLHVQMFHRTPFPFVDHSGIVSAHRPGRSVVFQHRYYSTLHITTFQGISRSTSLTNVACSPYNATKSLWRKGTIQKQSPR